MGIDYSKIPTIVGHLAMTTERHAGGIYSKIPTVVGMEV